MSRRARPTVALVCIAALGCSASTQQGGAQAESAEGASQDGQPPVADDRSLCEWRGRKDVEVSESRGPGASFENIRRVYAVLGQGEERRRVIRCREIDTNLDGVKDVARWYDEFGKPRAEQADSNYDGKIDTWIQLAAGLASRMEVDRDADGRPDERWFYVRGKPNRVQRDTNGDGRPDVFEVYADGRLDRVGVDLDGDGHVDRWDRDEIARAAAEAQEQKEASEEAPEVPGARRDEKAGNAGGTDRSGQAGGGDRRGAEGNTADAAGSEPEGPASGEVGAPDSSEPE